MEITLEMVEQLRQHVPVSYAQAKLALEQLSRLCGSEFHATVILSKVDEDVLGRLGIHLTMDPAYEFSRLYHK